MKLNERQKKLLAGKIVDFGNISVVALSFGSIIRGEINWWLVGLGFVIFIGSYLFALYLEEKI